MNRVRKAWQALTSEASDANRSFLRGDDVISGTYTGKYVDESNALTSTGVWSCTRVISETIASLPLNVYRRLPGGSGKEIAGNHALQYVLHHSANEELTAFEFWELMLSHILTWGNAFARIEMGPRGDVTGLIPITPDRVTVERDRETDVRYYRIRKRNGGEDILLDDQILHIPGLGYDGLRGYSPVQLMRQALGLALAAEEYGGRFFGNNATPPMYITTPGKLSDQSRDQLYEWLRKKFGGLSNSHKLGVFDQALEIKTVAINHRDIQFLELRKFQLEEIARIYRVPPHLIQHLERSTNNNIEHQSIDFAMHTIRPWLVRIEKRINKSLFGAREANTFFAEFVMEGLLRGDSASRMAFYTGLRNAGIITANEVRAKENMNPIEGGDELFIQGAMIPVSVAIQGNSVEQMSRQVLHLVRPELALDGEQREVHERLTQEAIAARELHDVAALRSIGRRALAMQGILQEAA